jgi:putative transposase
VFVERLWRSVKYEEVHLRAYETVSQAREGIGRYLSFYNAARPHQAHGGSTPDSAYFASLPATPNAARSAAQCAVNTRYPPLPHSAEAPRNLAPGATTGASDGGCHGPPTTPSPGILVLSWA